MVWGICFILGYLYLRACTANTLPPNSACQAHREAQAIAGRAADGQGPHQRIASAGFDGRLNYHKSQAIRILLVTGYVTILFAILGPSLIWPYHPSINVNCSSNCPPQMLATCFELGLARQSLQPKCTNPELHEFCTGNRKASPQDLGISKNQGP